MESDFFESETAVFAAGCFWTVQHYFDQVEGVIDTFVGYTGGRTRDPNYRVVHNSDTGHAEAVMIKFNPNVVSYLVLLRHFFRMHNPTQIDRQGPDIGNQYRSSIFYQNEDQKTIAEDVKSSIQGYFQKEVVTRIAYGREFWLAEEHHQKFAKRTGYGLCHVDYKEI